MNSVGSTCPKCGAVITSGTPEALCAACLFDAGLPDVDSLLPGPTVAAGHPRPFGDYELLEEIARGGMGIVFKARQRGLNRIVALKMMTAGAFAAHEFVQRFYREAETVARLDHPNIVPIYEVGEHDGHHYFTMKLVEGPNLAQALGGRPWPEDRAAALLAKVARAVHAAHQRGILHRDIKPANILLDASGEVFITDFGLAKLRQAEELFAAGDGSAGTPHYMAPEQVRGRAEELGTATDVYGLGVVLYQMLTGRTPFSGESREEIFKKIHHHPPARPHLLRANLDRDLESICLRCLEKRPMDRYFYASELADDLERWLKSEPIHARPASATERVWKWAARHPATASLAILAVCATTAMLVGGRIAAWQIDEARLAQETARQTVEIHRQSAERRRTAAAEKSTALEELRGRAEQSLSDAEQRSTAAEQRRHTAEQTLSGTVDQISTAGLSLYVSDLQLAQAAWERGDGARVDELLRRHGVSVAGQPDPRGFEWHHLRHALTAEHALSFSDHRPKSILGVAWFPNGLSLLTACADDAQLFSLEERRVTTVWRLPPPLSTTSRRALAISSDGELLAAACADGVVVWQRTNPTTLFVPSGPCSALAFAPSVRALAVGVAWPDILGRGPARVKIIDLAQFDPAVTNFSLLGQFDSEALALGWAPGSRALTAITPRGTVHVFSLASNAVVRTIRGSNIVTAAALAPNGRWAARALAAGQILLTDLATGDTRAAWREPNPAGLHLTFTADGRALAAGGSGQILRLWETENWRELPPFRGHVGPILDIAALSTNHLVSAGHDNLAHVWRRPPSRLPVCEPDPHRDTAQPSPPVFSASGSRVALSSSLDEFILWNPAQRGFKSTNYGRAVAFAPDGSKLLVWLPISRSLELRDAGSGQPLRTLVLTPRTRSHPTPLVSPDGRWVVAALSGDARVALFDATTGVTNRVLPFRAAAWQFAPDGQQLALLAERVTAPWNNEGDPGEEKITDAAAVPPVREVMLLDLSRGTLATNLSPWASPALSFTPDGSVLAVVSAHGAIRLLDGRHGGKLLELRGGRREVLALAFTPDGERLAAGSLGDDVVLWHIRAEREVVAYPVAGPVPGLAFSPDGRVLVAGGHGPYQFIEAPGWKPATPRTRPRPAPLNRTIWGLGSLR